jgi:hypothetical protein
MRKLIWLALVLVFVFGVFGCAGDSPKPTGEDTGRSGEQQTEGTGELARVVQHFTKSGLDIGETYAKSYEQIGAVDGLGVVVEGADIELYLFDPATTDAAVTSSLNDARSSGIFLDPAINREIPVVVNGNIMLFGLDGLGGYEHPAKDKIIEAFNSF